MCVTVFVCYVCMCVCVCVINLRGSYCYFLVALEIICNFLLLSAGSHSNWSHTSSIRHASIHSHSPAPCSSRWLAPHTAMICVHLCMKLKSHPWDAFSFLFFSFFGGRLGGESDHGWTCIWQLMNTSARRFTFLFFFFVSYSIWRASIALCVCVCVYVCEMVTLWAMEFRIRVRQL